MATGGVQFETRYQAPLFHPPDYQGPLNDIAVQGPLAYVATEDSLLWILHHDGSVAPVDGCL
jgi:hypothetical protein